MYRTIILLALSAILTSCSYSENEVSSPVGDSSYSGSHEIIVESNNNTSVDNPTLSGSDSIITASGGSGSIPTSDPSLTAPRAIDQASMENIMNNPGFAQCEKITDSSLKESCADTALYTKATLTKNTTLCNEIKNKKILGTCIANSSTSSSIGETGDPCVDISDNETKNSCISATYTNQAISKMDPIICEQIVNTAEQDLCKNNIIMIKATKNKDSLVCMQMDRVDEQEKCKDIVTSMK